MYQVFIFLLGHLHVFLHFFFTFIDNLIFVHPISPWSLFMLRITSLRVSTFSMMTVRCLALNGQVANVGPCWMIVALDARTSQCMDSLSAYTVPMILCIFYRV